MRDLLDALQMHKFCKRLLWHFSNKSPDPSENIAIPSQSYHTGLLRFKVETKQKVTYNTWSFNIMYTDSFVRCHQCYNSVEWTQSNETPTLQAPLTQKWMQLIFCSQTCVLFSAITRQSIILKDHVNLNYVAVYTQRAFCLPFSSACRGSAPAGGGSNLIAYNFIKP